MKRVLILVCLFTMLAAPAVTRADGPSWDREGVVKFLAGAIDTLTVAQATNYVVLGEARRSIKEWPIGLKLWAMKPFRHNLTDPGDAKGSMFAPADTVIAQGHNNLSVEYPVILELWSMPSSIIVVPATSDTIWYIERFAD